MKQVLDTDYGYWKAPKLIKDPEDFDLCTKVIQERFVDLKNIFVNLMSGDNYPHIGLNDFVSFCRDTEVLDGSMPTSTVDRMFIATKVNAPLGWRR